MCYLLDLFTRIDHFACKSICLCLFTSNALQYLFLCHTVWRNAFRPLYDALIFQIGFQIAKCSLHTFNIPNHRVKERQFCCYPEFRWWQQPDQWVYMWLAGRWALGNQIYSLCAPLVAPPRTTMSRHAVILYKNDKRMENANVERKIAIPKKKRVNILKWKNFYCTQRLERVCVVCVCVLVAIGDKAVKNRNSVHLKLALFERRSSDPL